MSAVLRPQQHVLHDVPWQRTKVLAVSWASWREGELDPAAHGRIASMLRAAFPAYANAFPGRRSWSGARPELRVVAHDPVGVAAHAGVLRRFIQVVDGDRAVEQLVAHVGLVAVRPDLQGSGIGRQLGSRVADSALERCPGLAILRLGREALEHLAPGPQLLRSLQ